MYKQVSTEEADALQLLGVSILFRFPSWTCSSYSKLEEITAREDWKNAPSRFFAVYDHPHWTNTGTPTFYVEVE